MKVYLAALSVLYAKPQNDTEESLHLIDCDRCPIRPIFLIRIEVCEPYRLQHKVVGNEFAENGVARGVHIDVSWSSLAIAKLVAQRHRCVRARYRYKPEHP